MSSESFFGGLITSKMRIRILMRLFINPSQKAYLRELADEFSASPAHLKSELDQMTEAGLLKKEKTGRKFNFSANTEHPVFFELHSMVKKALGMEHILDSVVHRLGSLNTAILTGDYAEGKDTGIIDLILIGDIDQDNLLDLTAKAEKYLMRKIRTLCLSPAEYSTYQDYIENKSHFVLWEANIPVTL
jgi:AraC-like DNA-binding protein